MRNFSNLFLSLKKIFINIFLIRWKCQFNSFWISQTHYDCFFWIMPELKFIPLILNVYSGLFNFNSFLGLSTNLGFFNFNGFLGFRFKPGFSFAAWVCNLKLLYSVWVQEWFARDLCFSHPGLKHLGKGLGLFLFFSLFYQFHFSVSSSEWDIS